MLQCIVICLLLVCLPARAALEGYWSFNGNANDQSGNGIAGTEVGAPVYEASVPAAIGSGQSLRFDGTNDYVTLGNPSSLDFGTENFSVGGWIKTTQAWVSGDVGKGTLYAKGGDGAGGIRYALIHNEVGAGNDGRLDFILDDNVTKSAISSPAAPLLNDGNWHHILGVRDGANQFLYVDGVLASSAALPPSYDLSGTSQADALIGAINSASTNLIYKLLEGSVDDVFVWRGALPPSAAADLYSGAVSPLTLLQSLPPMVEDLVPEDGAIAYTAANGLQFRATTTSTIATNQIKLILNGVDVSGSLAITGTAMDRQVNFSGLQSGLFYTGRIILTDALARSSTNDFTFDTLGAGTVVIEAEDYNYGLGAGGVPVLGLCATINDPPPATVSGGGFQDNPLPSGFDSFFVQVNGNGVGYLDMSAVDGVDFNDSSTTTGDASINPYRTCTPVGVGANSDYTRSKYTDLDLANWDLEVNRVITGDWLNYTRTFPATNYLTYLRVFASKAQKLEVGQVTSDPKVGGQTVDLLGVFNVPETVSSYVYVLLTDPGTGQPVVRPFSGVTTLRLTALEANNDVFPNFIVCVPTTDAVTPLGPLVKDQVPAEGSTVARNTTISATIENRERSVDVSTIVLYVDGVAVASTNTPTGSGATVDYTPPALFDFGSAHTAALAYDDTLGGSYSNSWAFNIIPAFVTLNFANSSPTRDFSGSGDSITLDFSIDGSGDVSMVATPISLGTNATDAEYLAAVNSWTGPVGTVEDAALFGETFQITIFVTLIDRTTGTNAGVERISLDGRYLDGIMGCGGGNGSRVDWTSGAQEWLHFEQTGGSAVINLLDFEYHGASTANNLWDTQIIAGGVSNRWMNLPGNTGTVDVSTLGYVIGSGPNELTFSEPLDGTHGLGVAGLNLKITAPVGPLAPLVATFDSGTGNLTISWSGPGQLQETPGLTSPIVWTNVPGVVGTSHVIAVGDAPQKFYRLAE